MRMVLPHTLRSQFLIVVAFALFFAGLARPAAGEASASSGLAATAGKLTCQRCTLWFGDVPVGQSKAVPFSLTNTGPASVTIRKTTANAAGFTVQGLTLPLTLAVGQSVNLKAVFAPRAAGRVDGNIAFTSNASNSTLYIYVHGTGVKARALTANPSSVNFGNVPVGGSSTRSQALTNAGSLSVTLSHATLTGTGFSLSGLSLPLTLAPGQSYTFQVRFAPQSSGSKSGSISVTSNSASSILTIPLSGTGTAAGQFSVVPATLSFGNVTVGTSKSQTATLRAAGSTVTVSSGTTSSSEFTLSGLSFPLTIAAGQSASFTVKFTPQVSGTTSASASFTSNASNSPAVESLSGTGTAAAVHSVRLSWAPSTSPVVGYNIYRGGASGGPYSKINSALDATTIYTDSSVQGGKTYYYVVKSVDSSGMESNPSNEVKAIVPSP